MKLSAARPDRIAYALMAASSAFYVACTVHAALEAPYWMDEVLAVWTARLPTARAVWDALSRGAEFSPPLFHLLLQKIQQFGGHGRLAMRAPSMLAVYAVALSAFVIVRRRQPAMIAALAFTLCLASGLVDYAVQARQYALVCACFALAAVLWDGVEARAKAWPSAAGIFILLAVAIGLHFYALLLAGALGLVELGWSLKHRRLRWPILIAIVASGLSLLAWLPILQHVSAFNRGDTAAPGYYARPTLGKLGDAYVGVLAGHTSMLTSPLIVAVIAVLAAFVFGLKTRWRQLRLDLFTLVACTIPVIVFVFAVLFTHTFNERYVIAAAFGFALIIAACVATAPHPQAAAAVLIVVLVIGMAFPLRTAPLADDLRGDASLADHAPTGLPIVTGNGLRFLELAENTRPETAARLVYLTAPQATDLSDPTNEHQVLRWKAIRPTLPVEPAQAFFAAHRSFLIFRDPEAAAEVRSLFDRRSARIEEIDDYDTAILERVTLPPVK